MSKNNDLKLAQDLHETFNGAVEQPSAVSHQELESFVTALSNLHLAGLKAAYPTCELNWETLAYQRGQKYVRLVNIRNGQVSSAFGFIDLTNGNILKCAGWKTPAKHARGNIRSGDASNLWNGAFTNGGGGLCVAYLR
jgi:hypothetical protein